MIDKLRPDILFLDVELPDMKGIELLEQINSCITWNMQVIFYTAYDKYMINAIRESAFDYLLKPIDRKELECIITRFLKRWTNRLRRWLFHPKYILPANIHL